MEMAESRKRKEHIVKQSRRCAVSVALVSNVLAVYVSVEYVSVWVCKQDFHKLRTPYAGLTARHLHRGTWDRKQRCRVCRRATRNHARNTLHGTLRNPMGAGEAPRL